MQLTEARVFEMVGRLHAENRELSVENEATKARNDLLVAEHRRLTDENAVLRSDLQAMNERLMADAQESAAEPKKKKAG